MLELDTSKFPRMVKTTILNSGHEDKSDEEVVILEFMFRGTRKVVYKDYLIIQEGYELTRTDIEGKISGFLHALEFFDTPYVYEENSISGKYGNLYEAFDILEESYKFIEFELEEDEEV